MALHRHRQRSRHCAFSAALVRAKVCEAEEEPRADSPSWQAGPWKPGAQTQAPVTGWHSWVAPAHWQICPQPSPKVPGRQAVGREGTKEAQIHLAGAIPPPCARPFFPPFYFKPGFRKPFMTVKVLCHPTSKGTRMQTVPRLHLRLGLKRKLYLKASDASGDASPTYPHIPASFRPHRHGKYTPVPRGRNALTCLGLFQTCSYPQELILILIYCQSSG